MSFEVEDALLLAGVAGAAIWLLSRQSSADGTTDVAISDSIGDATASVGDGSIMDLGDVMKNSTVKLPPNVDALIVKYAGQYGVDPNLLRAQAMAESGGQQSVKSSAGAVGVFQLMPATAAELGVNPNDLEGNVQGGAKYMSQLLTKYHGNNELALAAYNAGMGNVAKYGGVPPFAETQGYISKILAWAQSLAA